MEAIHNVTQTDLDLIIHSPGGSGEAAEAILLYIRSNFQHIRVFVPHMAMSAATMLACGADEIVMGGHSFIGPIDPQLQLQTALGPRSVAAQAIIQQFEMAKTGAADPATIRAWIPMLSQYGPDLLATCTNASDLSKTLVTDWLTKYMLRNDPNGVTKAVAIGVWLADHNHFKTHGRPVSRDEARRNGLIVVDLEYRSASARCCLVNLSRNSSLFRRHVGRQNYRKSFGECISQRRGAATYDVQRGSTSILPPASPALLICPDRSISPDCW